MRAIPTLKISISGVRGVVGDSLTPELVVRFAEAFGSYLDGGRVLVCRDPRPSGPMVEAAVTAGLLRNLDEDRAPGFNTSLVDCLASLARLRRLRDGGVDVLPGHDPLSQPG